MHRKDKKFTIITIITVALLTAGSIFFIYEWNLKKSGKKITETQYDEASDPTQEADKKAAYYNEVNYIGGIGYPEVYDVPFKISDNYITNKKLWENSPDAIPVLSETATDFVNKIMNIGYRNIMENREEIKEDLVSYLDPYWIYGTEEDEQEYVAEDYIDRFLDEAIDKKIATEGEFITDTSLVYYDCLYIVRGMLRYNVYSNEEDETSQDAEPKLAMMEVVLSPRDDGSGNFDVLHWFIKDYETTSPSAEED